MHQVVELGASIYHLENRLVRDWVRAMGLETAATMKHSHHSSTSSASEGGADDDRLRRLLEMEGHVPETVDVACGCTRSDTGRIIDNGDPETVAIWDGQSVRWQSLPLDTWLRHLRSSLFLLRRYVIRASRC